MRNQKITTSPTIGNVKAAQLGWFIVECITVVYITMLIVGLFIRRYIVNVAVEEAMCIVELMIIHILSMDMLSQKISGVAITMDIMVFDKRCAATAVAMILRWKGVWSVVPPIVIGLHTLLRIVSFVHFVPLLIETIFELCAIVLLSLTLVGAFIVTYLKKNKPELFADDTYIMSQEQCLSHVDLGGGGGDEQQVCE